VNLTQDTSPQTDLTAPALQVVEGQPLAVQFAGRTLTKDEAEQLAHALLDVVTEIDTAHWHAIYPELADRIALRLEPTYDDLDDVDDEQLERIAS
jgi:hypothetical protein